MQVGETTTTTASATATLTVTVTVTDWLINWEFQDFGKSVFFEISLHDFFVLFSLIH